MITYCDEVGPGCKNCKADNCMSYDAFKKKGREDAIDKVKAEISEMKKKPA